MPHGSLLRNGVLAAVAIAALGTTAAAQTAAPPPAVTVTPVVSRQVQETGEFIGRVTAIDKVDVVARVSGFIEERNFTEGQQVKKDDLLFRIEQATYKAAVEQQRAALARAKATEVNAKLALERGKELIRNNNIPQSTLDQRAADEAAAQASVLEAQALLDQAEINLGYTEIRSPIDGRIGLAYFTVGNLVGPSSGKLATIVSQDPIYVIFQASSRDVLAYKKRIAEAGNKSPHAAIHIRLPDGSVYPHAGQTNFLDVQVDPNTDTVSVRAQVPNPDRILLPGGVVGVTTERGEPRAAHHDRRRAGARRRRDEWPEARRAGDRRRYPEGTHRPGRHPEHGSGGLGAAGCGYGSPQRAGPSHMKASAAEQGREAIITVLHPCRGGF
jgi:membrane fusion protein, multidrug efflux system